MEPLLNLRVVEDADEFGFCSKVWIGDGGSIDLATVHLDSNRPYVTRDQALDFARKAAAAPEMYEALATLIEGALVVLIDGSDEIRDALTAGAAALAKARGEGA